MLNEIQTEHWKWCQHNFPDAPAYHSLLGAIEELGELCHHHLKAEQGIRNNENHNLSKQDAIGDVIIYLFHYCSVHGWRLEEIVEKTWEEVKKRDWKRFDQNGMDK